MKIVIDIPEIVYNTMLERFSGNDPDDIELLSWIKTVSTPLPKGHGRLIDADDIDNHIIGHVDTSGCPTIVPADKEESEGV